MNFTVDKQNLLYEGKVFNLRLDEITYTETGNKAFRQLAVHPGGAVVAPVTKDKKIVFVEQYRYPTDMRMLELPAGKLEPDEDPLLCATRELKEETGYTGTIESLGKLHTSPGFSTELLHLYVAYNLTAGEHAREEGEEDITMHLLSIDEIKEKIVNGVITDGKTITSMYLLENKFPNLVR